MSTQATLEAINVGLGVIRMLRSLQIDIVKLKAMQDQADQEGRELSDAELQSLADDAQGAIDRL